MNDVFTENHIEIEQYDKFPIDGSLGWSTAKICQL